MVIDFVCVRCNASMSHERPGKEITSVMCLMCHKNYVGLYTLINKLTNADQFKKSAKRLPRAGETVIPVYTLAVPVNHGTYLYAITSGQFTLQRDIQSEEVSLTGYVEGDLNKALVNNHLFKQFVEFSTSKPTTLLGHTVAAYGFLCRP